MLYKHMNKPCGIILCPVQLKYNNPAFGQCPWLVSTEHILRYGCQALSIHLQWLPWIHLVPKK